MKLLNWQATEELAVHMTDGELAYAIRDARKAAAAAWELEKAGMLGHESKTQGYYHDEISVYWSELRRRTPVERDSAHWVEAQIAGGAV